MLIYKKSREAGWRGAGVREKQKGRASGKEKARQVGADWGWKSVEGKIRK